MKYTITRDGQLLGQVNGEQIRAGLGSGIYRPTDLGRREDMTDSKMLGELFPQSSPVERPCLRTAKEVAVMVISVLACFAVLAGLFLALIVPAFEQTKVRAEQARAINHARQIALTLRIYAADHDGAYPDADLPGAGSSNEVLRLLFPDYIDHEMIFGCPSSPYQPDGNIGSLPDYLNALEAGENHWAMTKGLEERSPDNIPLVYENPLGTKWPPQWNASLAGAAKPGRAWPGGKIVIVKNDGRGETISLNASRGKAVGCRPRDGGSPIFTMDYPKLGILNVKN